MAQSSGGSVQFWTTGKGILLAAAIISSAIAWWLIAWPVASLSNASDHRGHFPQVFGHMLGGTGMLFLGALNLYLASARTRFPLHRRIGQLYLALGSLAAISALVITLSSAHKAGTVLINSTLSLALLGTSWLACAAMGWRAARNRRFESHGEWMVRSYILAWSFVFCRIASRVPAIGGLGDGEAFIWLSWVVPLLIGELCIQWPKGARRA
jgi:hypothetical protein